MKIGFALYTRALVTGISLATEMLACASQLRGKTLRKNESLEVLLITPESQPVELTGGLMLQSNASYRDVHQYQLIFLPPMWGNPFTAIRKHPEIIPWLQKQHQKKSRIIATGTGVCWLAESGLLNGQIATTHWYFHEKFAQRYPGVTLNRKAAITRTGQIYCARSINAQTELIVYLIDEYYGQAIATIIEQHFVHEATNLRMRTDHKLEMELQYDEAIAIAQEYMKNHFSKAIDMRNVADRCGLSLRTLYRKFKDQVGITPHQYLINIKMHHAKNLLKDMNLSLQEVAALVGYQSPEYFHYLFKNHFDLSPKEYRKIAKAKIYVA